MGNFHYGARSAFQAAALQRIYFINCLCDTADRALRVCALHWLRRSFCARRRPCDVSQWWGQRLRADCTPGSDWRSQVFPASVRTHLRRQRRFLLEMPYIFYDTTVVPEAAPERDLVSLRFIPLVEKRASYCRLAANPASCDWVNGAAPPAAVVFQISISVG